MTFMIQCTNKGSQNSLIREVDPVGVDGPGGPVGQDLVAVLALHLHRLVLVHEGDVLAEVAPFERSRVKGSLISTLHRNCL